MHTSMSANLVKKKENLGFILWWIHTCIQHHELYTWQQTWQQVPWSPASAWKVGITSPIWLHYLSEWKVQPILNHFLNSKSLSYLFMAATDQIPLCQTFHPNAATFCQSSTQKLTILLSDLYMSLRNQAKLIFWLSERK